MVLYGLLCGLGVEGGLILGLTAVRGSDEEATAYTDTLGDMLLGLLGSTVAAAIAALVRRSRSEP